MSDQAGDFRTGEGSLPAYAEKVTADAATGLHRWVENMSASVHRQATRVAIAKLDDWTHGHSEERPSRGEVKAWVVLLHADRQALLERVSKAERELDAVVAQRDDALEEVARVRRARDEARESYREDVEHFRAHVKTLDVDRARRTRERDLAMEECADLRTAYEHAESERNAFARERRNAPASAGELRRVAHFARVSCPHTPGGGAK